MANPRKVRAAAVQIAPDLGSREATLALVVNAIDEAARKGAELIAFPGNLRAFLSLFFVRSAARAKRRRACASL